MAFPIGTFIALNASLNTQRMIQRRRREREEEERRKRERIRKERMKNDN